MTATTLNAPIAFIGGGNMARALVSGLITKNTPSEYVLVADHNEPIRQALHQDFGIPTFAQAEEAINQANTWVLAVKPQVLQSLCQQLAPLAKKQKPLIISVAAGVTMAQLEQWLGKNMAIVRAMPNTPAQLGAGMTGLLANANINKAQHNLTSALMRTAGAIAWMQNEGELDVLTAISGSGPAYVFLFAEAMQAAAQAKGLDAATAHTLVTQTFLGAARMLTETDLAPEELRRRVTSPGGTTQAAIKSFQAGGFESLTAQAIEAAMQRNRELLSSP